MFSCEIQHWHFWQGSQFMASDEKRKSLMAFRDLDDCVNWLFVNGHRDIARALNGYKKDMRS